MLDKFVWRNVSKAEFVLLHSCILRCQYLLNYNFCIIFQSYHLHTAEKYFKKFKILINDASENCMSMSKGVLKLFLRFYAVYEEISTFLICSTDEFLLHSVNWNKKYSYLTTLSKRPYAVIGMENSLLPIFNRQ